jgi:hypothetical protein
MMLENKLTILNDPLEFGCELFKNASAILTLTFIHSREWE